MKRIRSQKALLLFSLFFIALRADIDDRIEYKIDRVLYQVEIAGGSAICPNSCTAITQALVEQGGGVFTCSRSGEYCLAGDITGRIAVAADCVCIDLACHTIDAFGAASAITSTGGAHEGLRVFNGCITNASVAA